MKREAWAAQRRGVIARYWLLGLVIFLVLATLVGLSQLSAAPSYSARTTVYVGSDSPNLPLGQLSMLTSSSAKIEDQLAVLESDSIRRYAVDQLKLLVKPLPKWGPSPLGYQLLRGSSYIFHNKKPLDYAMLSCPQVVELELDYKVLGRKKLWVNFDGKNKYALFVNGKRVDEQAIGHALNTQGLKITLDKFTSGPPSSWILKVTDPERAVSRLFQGVSVLRLGATSNTIGLKAEDAHPDLAVRLAETMMRYYMDRDQELSRATSANQLKYIDDQIAETRAEEQDLLEQVRALLADTSSQLAAGGQDKLPEVYMAAEQELLYLRNSRFLLQSVQSQAKSKASFIGYITEGLPAEIETGALTQIVSKERMLAQELETKTEQHPDVVKLRLELKTQREQLVKEIDENLSQLDSRVANAEQKLAQYSALLDKSPATSTGLTELRSEIAIRTTSIGELYAQRQLTNLRLISDDSPLKILDAAMPNRVADSPRLMLAAASAIVVAFLLTIALLIMLQAVDPRLWDSTDLERRFGVPVLACIGGSAEAVDEAQVQRLGLQLAQLLTVNESKLGLFTAAGADYSAMLEKLVPDALHSLALEDEERLRAAVEIVPGHGFKALYSPSLRGATRIVLAVSPGLNRLPELRRLVAELQALGYMLSGWIYVRP